MKKGFELQRERTPLQREYIDKYLISEGKTDMIAVWKTLKLLFHKIY